MMLADACTVLYVRELGCCVTAVKRSEVITGRYSLSIGSSVDLDSSAGTCMHACMPDACLGTCIYSSHQTRVQSCMHGRVVEAPAAGRPARVLFSSSIQL